MLSPENIHSGSFIWNIYTCNYHVKKDHELEEEQGEIYGRVWGKERNGRNVVIK